MSIKLYHQVGHHAVWNTQSYEKDECGDGLVLSPVHQKVEDINAMSESLKQASMFDGQYYLPNSQKQKLKSYSFFPETMTDGFSTADFSLIALDSARGCLKFQLEHQFPRIIIPARYFDQMDPSYTEKQSAFTLHPFLKAAEEAKVVKPLYMTLPLTSHMVMNPEFRVRILNWVTKYPELSGVYLFSSRGDEDLKQIRSQQFLTAYMEFIKALRKVDLGVIAGYCNTEGLLYTLIDGCEITFGAYENTRMFSLDKFIVSDEEKRGPAPRLYLPGLLTWVRFSQAKSIRDASPEIWKRVYSPTPYGDEALDLAVEPHFGNPRLYKHHFIAFQKQVEQLSSLDLAARYGLLRGWIKDAIELNAEIQKIPMDLEKHSQGEHLQPWLDSINSYYAKYLKPT